jgi:flagellar protein FlbD
LWFAPVGLSGSRFSGIASPKRAAEAVKFRRNLAAFSSHIDAWRAVFRQARVIAENFGNGCTWPSVKFPRKRADEASGGCMVHLTRLNNSRVTINSDLIKFVEQSPDTVITLLNGEKILVQEAVNEVVKRVVEFRREVLSGTTATHQTRASAFSICGPTQQPNSHCEEKG